MNSSFCLKAAVLLWISTAGSILSAVVDIRRIPGQPEQLLSGDSVVLICTVTTNTVDTVQWFNGSSPLSGNGDGVIITLPYRLNNAAWQAAMEIVVLTVHSSGWYYCRPDELDFGSIQLNVQDAGEGSSLLLSHSVLNLYATIPFIVKCTCLLPLESQLQVEILWYRGESEISSLGSSFSTIVHTEYVNSTMIESQLTMTEPLPSLEAQYKCVMKAFTLDIVIYTLEKVTPTLQIEALPSITLTLESTPAGGPVLDSTYTLTCTGGSSINMSSVSLEWKKLDGTPVLSGGNLVVGEVQNGGNGSFVSLIFSKVLEENEDVYSCYGSMELYEYPNHHPIENTVSVTVEAPVQVTSVSISPLPSDTLDWYEGDDAALICTIQTNKATGNNLIVEWHNSLEGVINSTSVVSLSGTAHQSILELKSLSVHTDVYYCRASVSGAGVKQDWHYVNVESDIPSIRVLLTHPSPVTVPTAGMPYSLYCSHDKLDINDDGQPSVSWIQSTEAADSVIKQDPLHIVKGLQDNGTHFVSELQFVSVDYRDVGEYICEIEYNIFGSLPNVLRSDSTIMKVQVAPPSTVIDVNQGGTGIECTVQLNAAITSYPLPSVTAVWYLTSDSNTSVAANSVSGLQFSDLSVLECYEFYETSLTITSDSDAFKPFKSVSCEVNISIDENYVISSSTVATLDLQSLHAKVPSRPSNVMIRSTGSRWAEILWISSDNDVTVSNFRIEYQRNDDNSVEMQLQQSTHRIYPSLDDGMYSAVVTDLSPAVGYSAWVIIQLGANMNRSETIEFTTDEAAPTGIPLNLSRSYSQNGAVLLQWSPPNAAERNGVITGYNVSCEPSGLSLDPRHQNESIPVQPHTNVSLYGLVLETAYQCSVAAVNKEGTGPKATLQFSLFTNDGSGAVTEYATLWEWNSYSLVAAGVLGVVLLVVIISLAISVCYYKRKLRLYFQHVCKGLSSSPSGSLNRREDGLRDSSDAQFPRYVPSDTIDRMVERAHRHTALRRQSSAIPLQQELKQIESEL